MRDQGLPFVVAHRAGNDVGALRRAESEPAVRLIEADVHWCRGRLEVRHLKTLGPLPVLWDRWALAPGWGPRLLVDRLLGSTASGTELMLDLKGRDVRLAEALHAALGDAGDVPVTVCSRSWRLLERFAGIDGVRVVHSVGSARQLQALRRRHRIGAAGVSIHRRLLDPAVVAELRGRTPMLMTWAVRDAEDARRLGAWGVDGVIVEDFAAIAAGLRAVATHDRVAA